MDYVTQLLALPYFHPIRFVAIDTMHNLLLGTGKHSFEVWIETELLTTQALVKLEHCIKLCCSSQCRETPLSDFLLSWYVHC